MDSPGKYIRKKRKPQKRAFSAIVTDLEMVEEKHGISAKGLRNWTLFNLVELLSYLFDPDFDEFDRIMEEGDFTDNERARLELERADLMAKYLALQTKVSDVLLQHHVSHLERSGLLPGANNVVTTVEYHVVDKREDEGSS